MFLLSEEPLISSTIQYAGITAQTESKRHVYRDEGRSFTLTGDERQANQHLKVSAPRLSRIVRAFLEDHPAAALSS